MAAITAIILAGGKGRRMQGQDKGLLEFQGVPLIENCIQRLSPQTDHILISANRNLDIYTDYASVIEDKEPDFQGPLSGLYSCLPGIQTELFFVTAVDYPFLPADLVSRLSNGLDSHPMYHAVSEDGFHSLYLAGRANHLNEADEYRQVAVKSWLQEKQSRGILIKDPQAFVNINTLQDLEAI